MTIAIDAEPRVFLANQAGVIGAEQIIDVAERYLSAMYWHARGAVTGVLPNERYEVVDDAFPDDDMRIVFRVLKEAIDTGEHPTVATVRQRAEQFGYTDASRATNERGRDLIEELEINESSASGLHSWGLRLAQSLDARNRVHSQWRELTALAADPCGIYVGRAA